jgi:hypothetical protein
MGMTVVVMAMLVLSMAIFFRISARVLMRMHDFWPLLISLLDSTPHFEV